MNLFLSYVVGSFLLSQKHRLVAWMQRWIVAVSVDSPFLHSIEAKSLFPFYSFHFVLDLEVSLLSCLVPNG